jgi:tetratricopeptide (TPR) repeat protein
MSRRLWGIALAVATTVGIVGDARADTPPSLWDRARQPSSGDTYRLHLEVQRRIAAGGVAIENRFITALEPQLLTVRSMLERAHAETSPDVLLRFDLGQVYLLLARDQDASFYRRAAEILKPALEMAPDHPAAEDAWGMLSEACGHLGDHACERRAYQKVLRDHTEEHEQGVTTMNLAETEMHFGNLKEAIEGYREALRIASRYPSRTLAPLSIWGMAVAFDRSGDTVAADREANRVLEMQASSGLGGLLRMNGIYFYPDYEISWYDAVGASALARKPNTTAADAARHWKAAEDAFAKYVAGAERRGNEDRWLALAKVRLANAKTERERAEKRRGKAPPPVIIDDEEGRP